MDCAKYGVLSKIYISSLVVEVCDEPIDAEAFYIFTASPENKVAFLWEDHVVCDYLDAAPTGVDSFE